ncbi:MAG: TolC family protein [Muribaculaceae bacterium]|nr:TolC family protein [Muribaculaceae bacterium]
MKHASAIAFIISLMLPLQSGSAGERQESERQPSPMTLKDCLLYAREHAHGNRISRLEAGAASADKRISAADMMPYISFGSSGSLSFGRNIDPETNTYDNKKTLGTGFGLEMSLPLFDGLVRINTLKALKTAELRKKKAQLVEEDRISLEVIKGFYNISYCTAMVNQMRSQLTRDSTDLAAAGRELTLGTKSGADVAELEAIVAADRYELINQQNLLKKADLALRSAMGMPVSEKPLLIAEEPDEKPVSESVRILPEIEEAEMAVREGRMYLRAAKGGYSPRISFNAGVSTSFYRMVGTEAEFPSFARQFRDNMGEYLGLSFSFPIFDGLSTRNRVRKAAIQLRENEERLEQTRYRIDQATEEARLDHEAATEELSAAQSRLSAERLAYKAMRRRYELGAASAIELYTSSSKLSQAEANLTGKRIQKIISEITLRYYEGHPLISN